MTIAEPPALRMACKVGKAARMRRSLVTLPASSSGTLKSTRTSTRLPFRSFSSDRVFLPMSSLADHVPQQIDTAVRVAPFVVVPAHQFEEAVIQTDAGTGLEDAGVVIVHEVAGDDFILCVSEDT